MKVVYEMVSVINERAGQSRDPTTGQAFGASGPLPAPPQAQGDGPLPQQPTRHLAVEAR